MKKEEEKLLEDSALNRLYFLVNKSITLFR